jgi:hypothetical protein
MAAAKGSAEVEKGLKPWKYTGWPGFCRFAAGDDDFLILRRFDVVSVRVLLSMQDGIASLEEKLAAIDTKAALLDGPDFNNGSFRQDPCKDRKQVLNELKTALFEYSEFIERLRGSPRCSQLRVEQFLLVHSQIKIKSSACKQSVHNVRDWLYNNEGAIIQSEAEFTNATDLVNVVDRSRPPLRGLLESSSCFRWVMRHVAVVRCLIMINCCLIPDIVKVFTSRQHYQHV